MQKADIICGHNIIFFDIPCIKKLYPWFTHNRVIDTLVWSRLVYSDIKDTDLFHYKKWKMPGDLIGTHKLEAWGYRLGEYKGEFGKTTDWAEWSQEMSNYCKQDVTVTVKLYHKLIAKGASEESLQLEHQVATIIQRQIAHGWLFDEEKAQQLYVTLIKRKEELNEKLQEVFKPWMEVDKVFIPKRDNRSLGYKKGEKVTKYKMVTFNPASRQHIAYQLKKRYDWKPSEFTPSGQPKIDEDVLKVLPYPEAKVLAEFFMIIKRLGQVADGDKGWLRMVKSDGRIHGNVITNGAVTGRMTHNDPNVAQVPAVGVPFGKECRSLFKVPEGYKLVGCDAAALELRCLAHFMYPWDKGAYGEAAVKGRKEEGTDIHTLNMKALGIKSRDIAKTWFYAYIYGAGDFKLGSLLAPVGTNPRMISAIGKQSRVKFERNLPALGKLQEKVKEVVKQRGYLIGLDGRHLRIRSEHAALNTLLQSAGAVVMKKALVILDKDLEQNGLIHGVDYEFVGNIHDEFQIEVKEESSEFVGTRAVLAIQFAGSAFNFRCPLDGEFGIGLNWADTH